MCFRNEVLHDLPEADRKAKEVSRHCVSGIKYVYGFSSKFQYAHAQYLTSSRRLRGMQSHIDCIT
jgi:hypothetical protein